MIPIKGKYTNALFTVNEIDEQCVSQVVKMTNHFAFTKPIVLMPDCHAGKGSCIGFTMEMDEYVIPNVIGVDIGCGLLGWKYPMPKDLDLPKLDIDIREKVPFGMNIREQNDNKFILKEGHPIFNYAHQELIQMWIKLREKFGRQVTAPPEVNYKWWINKCTEIGVDLNRAQYSLGTLGGGNHFIELGKSSKDKESYDPRIEKETEEFLWVIVHSGSRNFGKMTCDYYQDMAKKRYKAVQDGDYKEAIRQIRETTTHRDIPNKIKELREKLNMADGIDIKGMETLTSRDMYNYLYDMVFAQIYATYNRECIMTTIRDVMKLAQQHIEEIETIHNFISPEDLIIRKGAIHAPLNKKIIIPFNMKDGTWICTGNGEVAWNNSAPHGAGRTMSRSQAKKELSEEKAKKQMKGIYTSCIPLDEAPDAYKSAEMIRNAIRPTASIIEEVKPIMNMKAG